jgi:hypothetical protein
LKRISLLFFWFFTTVAFSQSNLSDYNFVVVPKKFDFLSEPDKFQINSLLKYLFNQNGFNAYFVNELPVVDRCDGLYAEVEGDAGLSFTKVQIILKDCYNNEIYKSAVGTSKLKMYSTTFQDAMRNAFKSLEVLNVQQRRPDEGQFTQNIKDGRNMISAKSDIEMKSMDFNLPTSRYTGYSRDGKNYLLQKTNDTYVLFEENPAAENGLKRLGEIIPENETLVFKTAAKSGTASFSKDGLLILEVEASKEVYKPIR